MPVRVIIFYAVLVPIASYAWRRGGRPERYVAIVSLVASLLSSVVPYDPALSFRSVSTSLLLIDVGVLATVVAISILADRFWPMYFAAIQLLAVAVHGVRAFDPLILPAVYARMEGEAAYPALIVLMIGTWRHVRRAPERDWSRHVDRRRWSPGGPQ